MGLELYGTTPEQFAKLIRDDNAKWGQGHQGHRRRASIDPHRLS